MDAGALDQRHRQPFLRLPGLGRGRRLHLVAQQPAKPADPLVERSGQRRAGRGDLSARRGQRRIVGADGAADPRGRLVLCRPTRPGLQPVRACLARHLARAAAIRAGRRSDQDLPAEDHESVRASAASLDHRLCRMGARPVPRRVSALRRHRDRCRDRRDVRAQPLEQRVRSARGVCRSRRAAALLDRRPDGIPRPQRHARSPGGARRRIARSPTASAPVSIPAARCKPGWSSRRTARRRSSSCSARRRRRPKRSRCSTNTGPADLDAVLDAVVAFLGRRARHGSGEDTRPRDGHPAQPLAALPDARLPRVGARGVLSGERRLRLSRPAAGRDGAVRREAGGDARASAARGGAAIRRRATCSTGGCRNRGKGCARASPTTAIWLPMSPPIMSRSPAIAACSTRWCRFSKGRPCETGEHDAFFQPTTSEQEATLFEHCARALDQQSCGRQPRPAADRHRRLERRHEPGRRAGQGREHLARLVSSCRAVGVRAAWPTVAETGRAANWRAHAAALGQALERDGWDGDWYRRAYFDDGTPLGSAANSECRIDSIAQSWSVISGAGRSGPRRARHGGGRRTPRPPRRRAGPALHAALRPDAARSRATSRAIRPASARTAANTRTARSGR